MLFVHVHTVFWRWSFSKFTYTGHTFKVEIPLETKPSGNSSLHSLLSCQLLPVTGAKHSPVVRITEPIIPVLKPLVFLSFYGNQTIDLTFREASRTTRCSNLSAAWLAVHRSHLVSQAQDTVIEAQQGRREKAEGRRSFRCWQRDFTDCCKPLNYKYVLCQFDAQDVSIFMEQRKPIVLF